MKLTSKFETVHHISTIEQKNRNCRSCLSYLSDSHKMDNNLFIKSILGACYMAARQALHTAQPERVVSREKEMGEIQQFLNGNINLKRPGSLYISGAPGTGKTAVLSQIMKQLRVSIFRIILLFVRTKKN